MRRKFSGHWQTLVGRPVPPSLLEFATSKHRASHPPLFSHGLKSGSGWRIGWKTWKKVRTRTRLNKILISMRITAWLYSDPAPHTLHIGKICRPCTFKYIVYNCFPSNKKKGNHILIKKNIGRMSLLKFQRSFKLYNLKKSLSYLNNKKTGLYC